jgi:hypothetical protein
MSSLKKTLKEEYNRLKKALGKMVKPESEKKLQPVLQPVRTRRNF